LSFLLVAARDRQQEVIMDHWTPDPGNVAPTAGLEQFGWQQAVYVVEKLLSCDDGIFRFSWNTA
jgi:hypothetical protein